jgi:chromate reductase, NAD(P)H dehydrogenase (quinone)
VTVRHTLDDGAARHAALTFLCLSGSLRARSINAELLDAVALLAPAGVVCTAYSGLGALPHFNPDLDAEGATPPEAVTELRRQIGAADALVISCPEYAHGPAGAFKNLLDWMVSSAEMPGKVVCILNASTSVQFAPAALVESLRTMSTNVVTNAPILVPVNGRRMSAREIEADTELTAVLRTALASILQAIPATNAHLDQSTH